MRLSRIRVEQFKQFRCPLEIAEFEPGINLFTGPNEVGKSTLVAAIRAAFFERHRSGSVDDLRPWGDSSAVPTVELEFVVAGASYHLTKSFLGKKRCELQVGLQRFDGTAAEDHLAQLLGFQYAGRGASGTEHWGIPGLLWMQQGTSQEIKESVAHATDHLRTALNVSLGEVASSGGDEVVAKVEAARNELLTPATGTPRGALAEAEKKAEQLTAQLQKLDADISVYREKVDQLAALRREHAADELEKPWAHCRQLEQTATEHLKAVQSVAAALSEDRRRAAAVEERITLLRSQLQTFAAQEDQLKARSAALAAAKQSLAAALEVVKQWNAKCSESAVRYETARDTLQRARQADVRQVLVQKREEAHAKAASTAAALANAETEHAKLLVLQQQAAGSVITRQELEMLRSRHHQLQTLRARQAAAATRLRLALADGQHIELGDEKLSGTAERLLLETTTVTLPGLGQLEITPGGTNLAELRREETAIADNHTTLLQRLGVDTLEAAEARAQLHHQYLLDIKACQAMLKAFAPEGIDALRSAKAAHEALAKEAERKLLQLAPELSDSALLPSISQAEAAEASARMSLDDLTAQCNKAQVAAGHAHTEVDAATRELSAAQELLAAPERANRVADANQALLEARAEQQALAARIEANAAKLTQTRPDILEQDVARFRRSAEQHERQFNERQNKLTRLEVEVQASGADGWEEQRAEVARDWEQTVHRLHQLQRRAAALDHLLRLLRDKRRALTRRLQAPLQKHLNRHLQLLFPNASLEIDENLTPGPITRSGTNGVESGAFDTLSFGAREQMGVISRLAYADLLQEAGRPTLIILDDALVHSDAERLSHMKRVLFDAATRHQILLFTCHPGNWRDLGVRSRSLRDLKSEP